MNSENRKFLYELTNFQNGNWFVQQSNLENIKLTWAGNALENQRADIEMKIKEIGIISMFSCEGFQIEIQNQLLIWLNQRKFDK